MQHEELSSTSGIPSSLSWTKEDYDKAVSDLEEHGQRGEFGITANCLFNTLKSFHCVGQFPFDALHDFLEKAGPADALSILKAFISDGKFTLAEYNAVLRDTRLVGYESSNRPPPIKPHNEKLPGSALAVALHIRIMPFILWRLGITEEEENDLLDLLFILHKINEYIQADKLSSVDSQKFQDLLVDFFAKRSLCCEKYHTFLNIVPKYHFMVHYPNLMDNFGPLNVYWTARGEGKHRTYVNFVESAKNFINVTKTLAEKNQRQLATR
jgi:hypothetical protein